MNSKKSIAPCMGCTKREVGCHSTCEGYKEFRSELDNYNKEVRKDKYLNYIAKRTLKNQ